MSNRALPLHLLPKCSRLQLVLSSSPPIAQFLLAGPTSFTTATTTSSSSSNSSSSSGSSGHRHSTIIFGSARDNHELFDEYLQASACTRSPLPGQRQRRRKDRVVSRIKRAAKSVRIKSRSPGADRQRNHSASPAGPSSLQSTISFTQLASTLPDSVAPTPTHTHTRHSHNNHQHQQQQQQQPQQQQQHHGASSSSSSSPPGRPSTRPHSLPPQEGEWTPTPPPRRRSRKTAARSMLAQHAPHTPSQPPPRPPAPQSPATRATTASAESSAPPSSPATTTARTSTGC
ncbi:hypothetical protein PTSG_00184 [Salpingoeca rosetta]|uniref:Uncharacterized protein n=1 Tax=Salpingoeca rosetta (strain ATCC 50818 / BSB-021) TaxID=946362 RepID=F2TVR7_SALR5|nr:uncharacterized protein PTSG_00184 [Salpingoeca rosetta]EGD72163.1 hypothetical protein PTSG_00184 [Salpingoeca rosetta]|eukprot:XP_004998735.1 hypothetical protein PTSG_00184 [Salpingoeca rosetta]